MSEPGTQEEKPTDQAVTEAQAGFLGFLLLAAIAYFAFVFWQLPEGTVRWIITGLLATLAVATWLAAKHWHRLREDLPVLRRWGHAASDLLVFVLVVAGAVLAAIYLAVEDKVVLLKIFTVVYFSLLPALLYLQFSSRRTLSVWKDYVANLYKLEIDDPANLPRPPTLSRFFPLWKDARGKAWKARDIQGDRSTVETKLELANQYRLKFRDVYGRIPSADQPVSVLSVNSVHKLQVVMATVLITTGWIFVVQPESVFGRSFTPEDFELVNLPAIPHETFAFAFLGAYFYILQMLVRRYFQNDLKATAYINATMRIVIVILLVWVIDPLLSDDVDQATRSAAAFVIGVFPTVGWQFLQQILIRKPLGFVVDSLEPDHKLGDLDGLNIWYESRLLEVGVEDMQNLSTTDVVDLMLNTTIPIDRVIDWLDQAFLYLRVVDQRERDLLRAYGIRTATDLVDALGDEGREPALERLLNFKLDDTKNGDGRPVIKDGKPIDDGLPSRMLTLLATIETERNLQHVQAWKTFKVKAVLGEPESRPEAEAPVEAAPVPA